MTASDAISFIFQRRSIRNYTDQAVSEEQIKILLEAAMAAPNACNSLPWEFVVITDPNLMDELRSKMRFGGYNAPAAIAVCGNPSIANNSCADRYWIQDCSAAIENMLIAAVGLGLGTVWLGVYPLEPVIKTVKNLLNMPDSVTPLGIIYVGYPAEIPPARTQYDEHRVHWQQYEERKRKAKVKNAKQI